MIDPNCAVKVGTHHGPYWRGSDDPTSTWQVCDRHRRQYEERDPGVHYWRPAPAEVPGVEPEPAGPMLRERGRCWNPADRPEHSRGEPCDNYLDDLWSESGGYPLSGRCDNCGWPMTAHSDANQAHVARDLLRLDQRQRAVGVPVQPAPADDAIGQFSSEAALREWLDAPDMGLMMSFYNAKQMARALLAEIDRLRAADPVPRPDPALEALAHDVRRADAILRGEIWGAGNANQRCIDTRIALADAVVAALAAAAGSGTDPEGDAT